MLNYKRKNKFRWRIIYWSIVTLLFVGVVLPIFFFFYLFDANKVKQMIFQQFNTDQYVVAINGAVLPKTWHGLSLELSQMVIRDKNNNNLIAVKNVSCQLSWFYLIFGQYKVQRLSLNGVMLDSSGIERIDLQNLLNFSQVSTSLFKDLQYLNFYNVNSKNRSGIYKVSDGSLEISQISSKPKFNLTLYLGDKKHSIISTGNIAYANNKTIDFNDVNLIINTINGQLNLRAKASYQLDSQTIFLDKVNGSIKSALYLGDVVVDNILLSWNNLIAQNMFIQLRAIDTVTKQNMSLSIQQLNMSEFSVMNLNNTSIGYQILNNDNKLDLNSFIDKMQLDTDLNIVANNCNNKVIITSPTLKNSSLNASLSGLCSYNLNSHKIQLKLAGDLNNANANLNLQINNNESIPYITVVGSVDNLDLSSISVNKNDVIPLYSDKSQLPLAWLGMFGMNADLKLKKFSFDHINLDNVQAKFNVAKDELNIKELKADIYSGKLAAQAKIKKVKTGYNISTNQTIHNFQLQSLFMNLFNIGAISGNGNIDVSITANNVSKYDDIRKNLSGNVAINASNGKFDGVDFDLFLHPSSITAFKAKKTTKFAALTAKFNFRNGISSNSLVNFSSPNVVASGGGGVDFINSLVDFNLNIKSGLPKNIDKVQSVFIPIKINGDLFDPQINIQNIELQEQSRKLKIRNKH